MHTVLRHILRPGLLSPNFFGHTRALKNTDFETLATLKRHISTQTWEFKDKEKLISNVYHHTVTVSTDDQDRDKLSSAIYNIIVSHPDSLFFLTQKSKLLRRSEDNPNNYLPLQDSEILNIGTMLDLIKRQWIRPSPGHTCMAITDQQGKIISDTQVSLRPGKGSANRVISGKTVMHPGLYPSPSSASVSRASHTTLHDEIHFLSEKMIQDPGNSITADLTVIPLAQTKFELDDILTNIRSARALTLYNLCSMVVKQKDIDDISESDIRAYIVELKAKATEFPMLAESISASSDAALAALACTHAVAKAVYGNSHAVDHETRPDQDTQTAVVYCTMALIGTNKFIEFAKDINFFDVNSGLTKK